jgi:hypothetical protein
MSGLSIQTIIDSSVGAGFMPAFWMRIPYYFKKYPFFSSKYIN